MHKYDFSLIRLVRIKTQVNIYQGVGKQIFPKTANKNVKWHDLIAILQHILEI